MCKFPLTGCLQINLDLKRGLWVFRKSQKISTASDQYFLSYVKKTKGGGVNFPPPNRNRVNINFILILFLFPSDDFIVCFSLFFVIFLLKVQIYCIQHVAIDSKLLFSPIVQSGRGGCSQGFRVYCLCLNICREKIANFSPSSLWRAFLHFTPKPQEQLQNPGSTPKPWDQFQNLGINSKTMRAATPP